MPNVRPKKLVECDVCDALYQPSVVHVEESHGNLQTGFPAGVYPLCPCCGHASDRAVSEIALSDAEPKPPRALDYEDIQPYSSATIPWPRTRELLGPFVAFRTNVLQLESMRTIPMDIGWLARLWQKIKDEELLAQLGSLNQADDPTGFDDLRFLDKVERWLAETSPEQKIAFAIRYGPTVLKDFNSQFIWRALHAMLVSQITSAWTAFESLAGDLWEAALNAHPHTLSALKAKGKPEGTTFSNERQQERRGKEEKTVRLAPIQKYKFDLSKHMGTLLKQRFNFTSLNDTNGIRVAYWQAFKDKRVRAAIDAMPIRALACVRNVFVHKVGVIDDKFSREIASVKSLKALRGLRRIPLTGRFAHDIVSPAIAASAELVLAVDDWIDARRRKLIEKAKRKAKNHE